MAEPCYSIVRKPKRFESANEITLKRRIEGDDLNKCKSSIEELLQSLLDGEKFPTNLMMPVINRYQMNQSIGAGGQDKRIKKLLYILWECLPKRGPDGKFLDKMVMVCGAYDKDLKHPNQYVCGNALRALSKTREPEVIRELIHSIEKCLEWSHSYQRKNAVMAISRIYKNFPDLNQSAPKQIAEYLMKENDDECKKTALQALLDMDSVEAKPFLHSINISEIHCMNTSIQLLFVELIQKLFKKGSEESESYIQILMNLIRHSSSLSVRYQAATALIKFTRDYEAVKTSAACFIDICAKHSDNNVKLIALDNITNLRKIRGAERVLRSSIMDILFILQSATDLELNEKILKLTLDLLSPLNVSGVVVALRQELKKMQDNNVMSSQTETVKYRRLLVDTVHQVAERFPNAIVEHEMLDTLFDLLNCNTIGDRTSSRLILLLRVFMSNNPKYRGTVINKIQNCFEETKENVSIHRGLVQLLGDFSETSEQIESSYNVIKSSNRQTASVLSFAVMKMACKYLKVSSDRRQSNRMLAKLMAILVAMSLIEGEETQTKDDLDNLQLGVTTIQQLIEQPGMLPQLIDKIPTQKSQKEFTSASSETAPNKGSKFDDDICISLFANHDDDLDLEEPEMALPMSDMFCEIPLTGTIDPIYAYCEFDVNQYDIGLKIHLENRTKSKTFENVTLELSARGDNSSSNFIDRPEPIVLAPRGSACITTNVKVVSADVRRMFGSIAFDDLSSDDKEQVIMLNDINVNITDYIRPSSISFDDFRDIWRECEWENKVTVKTRLSNFKDYLSHLVAATNMRVVTSDRGLSGECSFLSANLYAKSSFGEEALVNVSVEKETAASVVTGNVKIRSRSQGMALSLGEKITTAQNVAAGVGVH